MNILDKSAPVIEQDLKRSVEALRDYMMQSLESLDFALSALKRNSSGVQSEVGQIERTMKEQQNGISALQQRVEALEQAAQR